MEKRGASLRQMAIDTGLAEKTLIRVCKEQIGACRLDTLIIANCLICKIEDLFTYGNL